MATDELFDLVNESGEIIGSAWRSECHGNPRLMHPVVHCLVTNAGGDLLLQLRARDKLIQPGKWDTSVGGHFARGEDVRAALVREMEEEIGVAAGDCGEPVFLYRYVMRNAVECELVHTFACQYEGPFVRLESEIDELRFWSRQEVMSALGSGMFTPNFEDEFQRFTAWLES